MKNYFRELKAFRKHTGNMPDRKVYLLLSYGIVFSYTILLTLILKLYVDITTEFLALVLFVVMVPVWYLIQFELFKTICIYNYGCEWRNILDMEEVQ